MRIPGHSSWPLAERQHNLHISIGRKATVDAILTLPSTLRSQGYLPSRDQFFSPLGQAALDLGFSGTLSWQVSR